MNLRREALRSILSCSFRSARHIGYSALHFRRFARAFSRSAPERRMLTDRSVEGGGALASSTAIGLAHSLNANRVRRFGSRRRLKRQPLSPRTCRPATRRVKGQVDLTRFDGIKGEWCQRGVSRHRPFGTPDTSDGCCENFLTAFPLTLC